MGCLNVQIENRTLCDVAVNTIEKNVHPIVFLENKNTALSVETNGLHYNMLITTENKNKEVSVTTVAKEPTIQITVGLVCQVSLEVYKTFYVSEGPFIVEEGYFKVAK